MIITISGQPFRDLFVLGRQLVAEIVLLCLSRLLPDHTARQTLRVDTHHLLLQQLPVKVVASQVVIDRDGKCHGYDGYIRVKKLASSGKNLGRTKNKPLFGRFVQQV